MSSSTVKRVAISFDAVHQRRGTGSIKHDVDLLQFKFSQYTTDPTIFDSPEFISAWVGDMDFASPEPVLTAIRLALEGAPCLGYSMHPPLYFWNFAKWFYERHGVKLMEGMPHSLLDKQADPASCHQEIRKHLVDAPGGLAGLSACLRAVTSEGDGVAFLTPAYHPFFDMVTSNKRVTMPVALTPPQPEQENFDAEAWSIDFGKLAKVLSDPSCKLFLFCSPHNPLGIVWGRETVERIARLCLQHEVYLCSDEVWGDLIMPSSKIQHASVASLPVEMRAKTMTVVGLQKTFNLAGIHQATVIVWSLEMRKLIHEALDRVGHWGPIFFSSSACVAAMSECDLWLKGVLEYIDENFRICREGIHRCLDKSGKRLARVPKANATYLLWIDFSPWLELHNLEEDDLTRILVQHSKMATEAGSFFGEDGRNCHRINIACSRSLAQEITKRLVEVLTHASPRDLLKEGELVTHSLLDPVS